MKKTYRVHNWSDDNQSLVECESLNLWIDEEVVDQSFEPGLDFNSIGHRIYWAYQNRNVSRINVQQRRLPNILGNLLVIGVKWCFLNVEESNVFPPIQIKFR